MTRIARSASALVATCTLFGAFCVGAQAQDAHRILNHRHDGRYMSASFDDVGMEPSRRSWIAGMRDDDGANAKNPALPWYARGRGQETGGPARMLIGE